MCAERSKSRTFEHAGEEGGERSKLTDRPFEHAGEEGGEEGQREGSELYRNLYTKETKVKAFAKASKALCQARDARRVARERASHAA